MDYRDIEHYLQAVLGITTRIEAWPDVKALPFFLQDAYDLAVLQLLETRCVLMISDKAPDGEAHIRRHMDMLRTHAPPDIVPVYVAPKLASYQRKRLIAQKVSFIVPGNQLFIPELGMDLREYFREQREIPSNTFSPATQALLFVALLRPWHAEIHPATLAEHLHYTSMTISRVVGELAEAELATPFNVGRERWLRFPHTPRETWYKAQPWLKDPVRNTVWAKNGPYDAPIAGLSALAAQTMLAEPAYPVRAIAATQWNLALKDGPIKLKGPEPGAVQWQIWRYQPGLLPGTDAVDPLSLIISLRSDMDERVRQAVEQLEQKALPW